MAKKALESKAREGTGRHPMAFIGKRGKRWKKMEKDGKSPELNCSNKTSIKLKNYHGKRQDMARPGQHCSWPKDNAASKELPEHTPASCSNM